MVVVYQKWRLFVDLVAALKSAFPSCHANASIPHHTSCPSHVQVGHEATDLTEQFNKSFPKHYLSINFENFDA